VCTCCFQAYWSDSGELVCLATDESFYILRYNQEAVQEALSTNQGMDEDGIEAAFDVRREGGSGGGKQRKREGRRGRGKRKRIGRGRGKRRRIAGRGRGKRRRIVRGRGKRRKIGREWGKRRRIGRGREEGDEEGGGTER